MILCKQRFKRSNGQRPLIACGQQHRDRVLTAGRKATLVDTTGQKHEATKMMPEGIGREQQDEEGAKGLKSGHARNV